MTERARAFMELDQSTRCQSAERAPIQSDLDLSTDFLTSVRPRGPWTITAIHPDEKGAPTKTFIGAAAIPSMRNWIAERNKNSGVYFTANPTRLNKRPREEDMLAYQFAALDFDPLKGELPAECRERVMALLSGFALTPTFIWISGNGVQAMWRIRPIVMLMGDKGRIRRCKNANRGLIETLRSDTTQSLDHVFRLPGTINWPNAIKRNAGRKPTVAGGVIHNPECWYKISQLPKPTKITRAANARGLTEPPGGWDDEENVPYAALHCQNTTDLAREGVSGTAIRTALCLRDWGMSPEKCFDIMREYWCPRCEYTWDADELEGKIKRAYTLAQNDPGSRTLAYRMQQARSDFSEVKP